MKRKLLHPAVALVAAMITIAISSLADDSTISVSARQRYPWNGLADVHFTITGDAGTKYDTSFTAKDMVGNTNIAMRTIRKADGTAAAATTEQLLPGTYSWVWDAAADLPKDWKCDRVIVTGKAIGGFSYSVKFNANGGTGTMSNESFDYGTAKALTANAFKRTGYTFQGWATSASGAKVYNDKQSVSNLTETSGAVVNLYAVWKSALYMVIDLSSGSSSSSYPVSYLDAVPSGGWGNAYKTTKLVLRRIDPGSFMMGGQYNVTISKRFYMGIFEVTQKQWELIVGSNPVTVDKSIGDQRPVQQIVWNTIRGNSNTHNWPSVVTVDSNSFIGRLRKRTSQNFDLPTEAQWEYACRAGTTSKYNNGGNTENDLKLVGWFFDNQTRSTAENVGSLRPNNWGLYDMHGNQSEFCLDWKGPLTAGTDPKGPNSDTTSYSPSRVVRGGSWSYAASGCTSSYREGKQPSTTDGYITYGFRICLTLSE